MSESGTEKRLREIREYVRLGRERGFDEPELRYLLGLVDRYRAALEEIACPDCGGDGTLGRCSDGRLYACEMCGGHEDSEGTGINPAWREIREQALREQP